jgi:hypothetical protein
VAEHDDPRERPLPTGDVTFLLTHLSGLLLRAGRGAEALEAASGAVLAARRTRSDDALVPALEALAAASEAVGDSPRAAAAASEAAQLAA